MSATIDAEPFTLESPPANARERLERAIKARHRERDRIARRESDYDAMRGRAFICMAAEALIGVHDPDGDGATLDGVIAELSRRWKGEFVIWQTGRLVAVVRRERGRPVVTTFA